MREKYEEQQRLTTNGGSSAANAPDELEAYGAVTSPTTTAASAPPVAASTNGNGLAVNGLGDIYGERDGGCQSETDAMSPYDPCLIANGEEGIRRHLARARSSSNVLCAGWVDFELTFRDRSPRFIRFGLLLLITLLPFGAHFVKNYFSSLEVYFLEDPKLHFNETKYGTVMSAIWIPNLFMPFFGGLFLDSKGHKQGIILFLSVELIGHIIFTLAMGCGNFWMAVFGEAVYGLGSGTVVVAMRAVVSKFFLAKELTFGMGITIAMAGVSKTLAKASVAPVAERWGYMGALWYVALWQVLSLLAGLVYVRLAKSAGNHVGMEEAGAEAEAGPGPKDRRVRSHLVALKRSTLSFWLVAILHTLLNIAYHLFANYSGHFLVENYDDSPVLAGFISALMPLVVVLCAPIAGLILDRWGRQLYVLLVANIVTIIAYVLLLEERAGAVVCILMLAFCESFVPAILLSALPLTVHPSVYGAAFGMAEVLSAVGNILSNVFFGYSKDRTSSYKDDMVALVVVCVVCLGLTLLLLFSDAKYGKSLLNRGKRTAPADVKLLG